MLKLGILAALVGSLVLGAASCSGVLLVDVKADDGPRILVPVPLLLAQVTVQAAESFGAGRGLVRTIHRDIERELPADFETWWPSVRTGLQTLRQAGDAELMRVQDGDERVLIRTRADFLEIRVRDGRDEHVEVNLPLDTALEILDAVAAGDVEPSDMIRALRHAPSTQLVRVTDGDEHVRIRLW